MPRPKYPKLRDPDHITIGEALTILDLARASFYRYREEPDFPSPIGNDGKAVLYSRRDILEWKRSRQPK